MAICYQDGTEITEVTINSFDRLWWEEIDGNNRRLSAQLLTDRRSWATLYMLWIKACVDYMWSVDHAQNDEAPMDEQKRAAMLFGEGARAEDCGLFLNQFQTKLGNPGFPHIFDRAFAAAVRTSIDQEMAGAPPYLRLRASVICLLTRCEPSAIFSEGPGWAAVLNAPVIAAQFQASVIEVRNGDTFTLDPSAAPDSGGALIAKTLMNNNALPCSIQIVHHGAAYPVRLPPYGFLRAVFSDDDCKKLVSLKGGISCCDTNCAMIQKGSPDGLRLFYAYQIGRTPAMEPYTLTGPFWDAAADERNGTPGAIVLTANGLYSTFTGRYLPRDPEAPLPIRCYRSGGQWAWLYADGTLEGHIFLDGERMNEVTAVVEDAERGLLICQKGTYFDYRNIEQEPAVSEDDFVAAMLSRFLQAGPNECEVVATEFIRWTIDIEEV